MTKLRRSAIVVVVLAAVVAFFAVRAFSGGDSVKHLSLDTYTKRLAEVRSPPRPSTTRTTRSPVS